MATSKRYFSEGDPEGGITRSQLKRLRKAEQIEYLTYWFHSHYQDPVHRTSYDSGEGGYLWNHGGPYDASEELYEEFGDIISEKRLSEAVDEIEIDGTGEWARGDLHPDELNERAELEAEERPTTTTVEAPEDELEAIIRELESGVELRFGDAAEVRSRQDVLSELDRLDEAVTAAARPGIGHNNPPPDAETSQGEAQVAAESATIRTELAKPQPNAVEVAQSVSRLKKIGDWLLKKADTAADSFIKTIAVAVATGVAATIFPPLGELVTNVVQASIKWLSQLMVVLF